MQELLISLRSLLELGFPAIALVQLWLLWRSYEKRVNEHIRDLRVASERFRTQRCDVVCENAEQLSEAHDDKRIARA
jgi:hypothetical protein